MSIGKRNKDQLKNHGHLEVVTPVVTPKSNDPLQFWTEHPTESMHIDLRPYADGEFQNPHPRGGGNWGGAFTGRPQLIAELAPAIQARCTFAASKTVENYTLALRAWWRLFDRTESHLSPGGRVLTRVESVADLNELHETAAHQSMMSSGNFGYFLSVVNAARKLHTPRLPDLLWTSPEAGNPVRTLIPEDQARAIKTCLKQDWEHVRRTWARHDAIRAEADRRAALETAPEGTISCGEIPSELSEEDEHLLRNWQHFQHVQRKTGALLPTGEQLFDGKDRSTLRRDGLDRRLMRSIGFPTVEDADVAFHLALMNSGWNPSTLVNLDGRSPTLIFGHPKDASQTVLSADDSRDKEVTMQADKPRAHGKAQFFVGLKKHMSAPPVIVAIYLERVKPLREQLKSDYTAATTELTRLQATGADEQAIKRQYKQAIKIRQGCRNVWLYVDQKGEINWLSWTNWKRYSSKNGNKTPISYLDRVLERLNNERTQRGKSSIPKVTPSDFRDIYARWVYVQTDGNILAVMLALGHTSSGSTGRYLDNNIFSAENDEHARRFMTHLFTELKQGRVDLTILAQLVRHGPLTSEMWERLNEYRQLKRSRVGVGCADPRHPPELMGTGHQKGRLCGTQRCLHECSNARFLPESLDGIAMRVEELWRMSDLLPRETWLRGGFQKELDDGKYLLENLYPPEQVAEAREKWSIRIARGKHLIPGLGLIVATE